MLETTNQTTKEQAITLTVFSTERDSSQLCEFVEGLQKSGTEWVEGITVALKDEGRRKYDLERHFAAHPNGIHGTVQVMENQLWVGAHASLIEGALRSNEIPYARAQVKITPSYLNKRNSKIPLEDEDFDVRYTPQLTSRLFG